MTSIDAGRPTGKAPRTLNHVAYPTWDSVATYHFYTEVVRCEFVGALHGDQVPSTGEDNAYLHTFYALDSGECIAFFEVDNLPEPIEDGVPKWIRHLALTVPTLEDVEEFRRHLKQMGVEVTDVVDHDGIWESIYFFDPNGVRLEVTAQLRPLDEHDREIGLEWLRRYGLKDDQGE
jgi:catechol 2,3-dioxygenase-like lactoylglutathione lyase family enzyme